MRLSREARRQLYNAGITASEARQLWERMRSLGLVDADGRITEAGRAFFIGGQNSFLQEGQNTAPPCVDSVDSFSIFQQGDA